MIANRWRKQLDKKGMSQADLARQSGQYAAMVSHIVSGAAAPLTREDAERMCAAIGCKLEDVYDDDVIRVLYGRCETQKQPKPKKQDTRVRLAPGVWDKLYARANNLGMDISQYVNHLLIAKGGIDDAEIDE